MTNVLLTITYDGSNYSGWQYQPSQPTIEGEIRKTLQSILNIDIKLMGAGRTDRGVHALGQCALFRATNLTIPLNKLPDIMNKRLPNDIVISDAKEVPDEFHPRFSAIKKTYEYRILNSKCKNPLLSNYAEHVKKPLDTQLMNSAASLFLGTHDFKAFQSTGGTVKTSVRTILDISITREAWRNESLILLRVTGNSFLYNMVRIMAGTLIDVGLGKIEPDAIRDIILSQNRSNASKTAGAGGLTLVSITYE